MNIYLLGLILFLIGVSGNKLSYILGCNINKIFSNIYFTEFLTFLVIYTSIKVFGDKDIKSHLYHTLTLYILLKFFSKMNKTYTIISLMIIGFIIIDNVIKEKELTLDEEDKDKYSLDNSEKLLVLVIIVGFFTNLNKKYTEFGSKFNLFDFFFSKKCNNKIYG